MTREEMQRQLTPRLFEEALKLLGKGYRVYVPVGIRPYTWFHYATPAGAPMFQVAYVEDCDLRGIRYVTVHRANASCGTGFTLDKIPPDPADAFVCLPPGFFGVSMKDVQKHSEQSFVKAMSWMPHAWVNP